MRLFVFVLLWIIIAIITVPHTYPIKPKKKKCRVVCSLTTRPEQPYYFDKVLDNLVEQFDAVYLTLPYTSHKGIKYPDISHPGVTITRVKEDLGPITKFFGALEAEKDPNTLIVVVDDDIIYKPNFRRQFMREHLKYPNCVLTGAGIVYKYSGTIPWYFSMTGKHNNMTPIIPSFLNSNHTTTIAGTAGIAFERKLVDSVELENFFKKWGKNKDCFYNDDMIISAYFSSKKITRLYANIDTVKAPVDKDTESLSINAKENIFNTQYRAYCHMKECFTERHRFDCICGFDIIILIIIIYWSTRN